MSPGWQTSSHVSCACQNRGTPACAPLNPPPKTRYPHKNSHIHVRRGAVLLLFLLLLLLLLCLLKMGKGKQHAVSRRGESHLRCEFCLGTVQKPSGRIRSQHSSHPWFQPWAQRAVLPSVLWMDVSSISHHFETMVNHCLLAFAGQSNHSGVSWVVPKRISSIHSMSKLVGRALKAFSLAPRHMRPRKAAARIWLLRKQLSAHRSLYPFKQKQKEHDELVPTNVCSWLDLA